MPFKLKYIFDEKHTEPNFTLVVIDALREFACFRCVGAVDSLAEAYMEHSCVSTYGLCMFLLHGFFWECL